jgi:cell division cycle protein 20 (cofactor of APC complex)
MDALFTQGLIDTIEKDAKPKGIDEEVWTFRNRMACAMIRLCLTQDIKYNVMTATSAKKLWEILKTKYLKKSIESRLFLKRRLYRFHFKRGNPVDDHLNAYTKLLADLVKVDVEIEDEDKACILLYSLPDEEYETFMLTLMTGKETLNYNDVSGALINHYTKTAKWSGTMSLTK